MMTWGEHTELWDIEILWSSNIRALRDGEEPVILLQEETKYFILKRPILKNNGKITSTHLLQRLPEPSMRSVNLEVDIDARLYTLFTFL